MKKFRDELNLVGKFEEITMMELRQSPGEVIDQAMMGKTFFVKRAGKVVAVIQRPPTLGEFVPDVIMSFDKNGKLHYSV